MATGSRGADRGTALADHPEPSSAWSPFHHATFSVLWTATVVSNIGSWMYSAASGWLMTSLNPDPFIVSMVQVATTLPVFLFALPAGALADIVDRRKFLIVAETAVTALSTIFAAIVGFGLATPGRGSRSTVPATRMNLSSPPAHQVRTGRSKCASFWFRR
jgi:MFS family permease